MVLILETLDVLRVSVTCRGLSCLQLGLQVVDLSYVVTFVVVLQLVIFTKLLVLLLFVREFLLR